LKPSFSEFGNIKKDWTQPWSGQILRNQNDQIIRERGNGDLVIYDLVLRDDQVYASLQQRFALQTSLEWQIEPGGDSPQDLAAWEFIKDLINSIDFDRICQEMLYGIFYGFSVAELLLIEKDGKVTLDIENGGIRVRNRRRFWFDKQGNIRIRTANNYEGEIVDDSRVWRFAVGSTHSDDPYGCGLAYWLYWITFFKRGDMRLWLQNLEAEATRRPVAKYPMTATDQEKADALEAAIAIGEGKPFAVSENTIIELQGTIAQGGTYERLWEACNQAISKIILSQTMTLDDGSSLAQAEVHERVLEALIKSDSDIISQSFNSQVIARLTEWNFAGAKPPKLWRTNKKNTDRKLEAEIDQILIANGWYPTEKRIVTTFGEDYQKAANPLAPEKIRSGGVFEFAEAQDQDTIDLFVGRALKKTRPVIRKWIERLRKELEDAETLEAFSEAIPELYNELDGEELEGILSQAMQASQLAGIFESAKDT
jgi:phage gp29-like protein